jgi:hypothetical protein
MADIQFNPMDPEFVADPYPTYHRLRAEDPVHHSTLGFWVLTRYADVIAMLRDPRLVKEPIAAFVAARFGMAVPPGLGLSMLDRDPPDHTRLRGLVSKAFTPCQGRCRLSCKHRSKMSPVHRRSCPPRYASAPTSSRSPAGLGLRPSRPAFFFSRSR